MKYLLFTIAIFVLASCADDNNSSNEPMETKGPQFQWDFSKQRTFTYSYTQKTTGTNRFGAHIPAEPLNMKVIGNLNVRVKDSQFADVSLTNLESSMVLFDDDGIPEDTMQQQMPTKVIQDLKPDGSFNNATQDILFDLLFPLPKKPIAEGETYEIPFRLPFNAGGSILYSKGQSRITFMGHQKIEGKTCAVFSAEINVSQIDIPKELSGDYRYTTTGIATYSFDQENGYFVETNIQLDINVMMDAGSEDKNDFGMNLEMKSRNEYKIRLEKIAE